MALYESQAFFPDDPAQPPQFSGSREISGNHAEDISSASEVGMHQMRIFEGT